MRDPAIARGISEPVQIGVSVKPNLRLIGVSVVMIRALVRILRCITPIIAKAVAQTTMWTVAMQANPIPPTTA
jgi:hypothetical protein